MDAPLDTIQPLETPEGVDLSLIPAGPVPRAMAWAIDFAIRVATIFVFAMAVSSLNQLGVGLILIAWFLIDWFYPVVFEVLWRGRTPGKMALQLAVVREDGTPVSWPESTVRNLLRAVDFLPGCFGVALGSMLLSRRFQRLGDMAAGTLVVYRAERARKVETPRPGAEALAPPIPLSVDEQRAVLDFADRAHALNVERAEELASIAAPSLGIAREPVAALRSMAAWLRGNNRRGAASSAPPAS